MSEFKPGDLIADEGGSQFYVITPANPESRLSALDADGSDWYVHTIEGARRLVVIDPESDEDAERLGELVGKWADRVPYSDMREDGDLTHLDAMQAALREFANPAPPKPYREVSACGAPWPVLNECHSIRLGGHECPQCAWEHEHDWVAWTSDQTRLARGDTSVAIRCTKCGGRKCDRDSCGLQRHHEGDHSEGWSE